VADNLTFTTTVATAPSGTVVATDDVGGVHYQIVKLSHGAADAATLVSSSSGLPVAQQGTWNVGTVTAVTGITNPVAVTDNGSTLSIDDGGGAITVDGTVTVNAGTNLNTSALALESGGNLAACATSLAILDNVVSGNEAQVDVVTQPARAATADAITAKLATDAIQNGLTSLTPKFAYVDTSSSGNVQVVAAVTSKKIRVLSYFMSGNGTTNVAFRSATAGQISNTHYLAQFGGAARAFSPVGHFETTAGEALQISNSAAVAVGVGVCYVEV
jgi:hypothetical protein